jgi:hypothetical protein
MLNSSRGLKVAHGVSMQEWEKTFIEASGMSTAAMSSGRSVLIDSVNAASVTAVDGGSWRLPATRRSFWSASWSTMRNSFAGRRRRRDQLPAGTLGGELG